MPKSSTTEVVEREAAPESDSVDMHQEDKQRKEEQKDPVDQVDREVLLKMLGQMLLIRRFEEKSAESYSLGKIGGFCHLYIGQEAVAVGTLAATRPDDYALTSYRDHGQALAMGVPPDEVMAELFGKAGGCSAGKGGSMHLFDAPRHFLGGHAIVGGQIPLATGVAYACKYRGTDQVTLCYFGEAAANQEPFTNPEHGSTVEASLRLHLRKQPVRHGHVFGPGHVAARHRAKGLRL
ncbi:MAG: thiamine pyrophosphate-dependent enzyme [Pyrinomonadaceae bacterium]